MRDLIIPLEASSLLLPVSFVLLAAAPLLLALSSLLLPLAAKVAHLSIPLDSCRERLDFETWEQWEWREADQVVDVVG